MSSNKSSENSFIVQGSILAIASIISRILGLIYRIPLTAIIGKTGNDYYGTAYEVYNIILIISSYSIPLAVSKLVAARMSEGQVNNAYRILKGSLAFAAISGGTASLIVYFGADFFTGTLLQTPFSSIALKVLSPVLLIVAIVGVLRGFFQGLHTMVPSAMSQIFEQIVNAIVSVAAAYFLFSYGAKVGAVLGDKDHYAAAFGAAGGTLGTALGAVTALIFMGFVYIAYRRILKKKIKRDKTRNTETYREIFKVLIFTIIPVLLSTTLYNVSSIINNGIFKNIANIQGYTATEISEWWGVFTGQYKVLINVPISIASALAASSVPSLASSFQRGEDKKVRRQISLANRFIMLIAFPCTVGMFVLAKPIMMLLFSDSDQTSANMMYIGAVAIIFYSISTLSNGLLQGIDRMKIPVRNAAIALISQVLVLLVLMLAFHLNIYAVILANAFYAFMMCILNEHAVKKYSGAVINVQKTYIIPGICSLIMGLLVFLSYKIIDLILSSNAIACIVAIIVGAFSYFVCIILFRGITESELRRVPKGTVLIRIAKSMHLM